MHPRVRLTLRVEYDVEEPRPSGQLDDLGLNGGLVPALLVPAELLLLHPVDVRALDTFIAADDEVQPGEQLHAVAAEGVVHGPPVRVVHLLAAGRQQHEDVVAQQVGLAEPHAGVVQRLEDAVDVVAPVRRDLDELQTRRQRLLEEGDVLRVVRVVVLSDLSLKEPVGLADVAAVPGKRRPVDTGEVRGPVGLRRQQLVPLLAVFAPVDEVLLLHVGGSSVITTTQVLRQGGESQGQGRQPLLPVDHHPLREGGHPRGGRQNDAAQEVPRPLATPLPRSSACSMTASHNVCHCRSVQLYVRW